MITNTELLHIAAFQIGNGGSIYRKYTGLSSGQPWCDAFVFWLFNANGCGSILPWKGNQRTSCPYSIKWAEKNLAQVPLYWALPCDLIYFDWELNGVPNHIGIVESRKTATEVLTIEGNTSGGIVDDKARNGKYVQGVFRPHFVPAGVKKKVLDLDGEFGYQSIYNLQLALGMKATGILTKETAKTLQRKIGATADGAIGPATARKLQKFLCCKQDGEIGPATTRALQKWINKANYPSTKKLTAEAATEPTATRSTPTKTATKKKKKKYGGTFPALNNNAKILNGMAFRQCWPYGTKQNKYTFKKGKPLKAYTKGIDKAYPNHKKWPNKRQRVGACCDVFVGETLGNIGIKVPKDLKNQLVQMPKMKSKLKATKYYKVSQFDAGMIVQRGRKDKSGHTFMIAKVYYVGKDGKTHSRKYIANAHYKHLGGCYAVMDSKAKNQKPSKWKYYKCYIVPGAARTYYQKGDYGLDVYRIQKFLKWAGFYKGKLDFDFGESTKKAVKAFKKAVGLKANGRCGELTIKKMKAYRK